MSIFGCFIFGVYFVIVCSIFMDFFSLIILAASLPTDSLWLGHHCIHPTRWRSGIFTPSGCFFSKQPKSQAH